MSRIPEGYRLKGETVVEEQQQVQRERDDDDDKAARPEEPTYLNTPVDKWTDEMYAAYAKAKPMGMLEKGFIGFVGNIIAGPIGAIGLTKLAEKAEKQQAAAVQSSLGLKMNDPSLTQAQADIYSSAVQKASVSQFGTLSPFSKNAVAGAGMVFSDKTAAVNYYAGLAAASDAGITTGYEATDDDGKPIFAGGISAISPITGTAWQDPDKKTTTPTPSSNDGNEATGITAISPITGKAWQDPDKTTTTTSSNNNNNDSTRNTSGGSNVVGKTASGSNIYSGKDTGKKDAQGRTQYTFELNNYKATQQ